MQKVEKISLLPVIKIEPIRISENSDGPPRSSREDDREGWESYNQSCYREVGLLDLTLFEKGGWLFELSKISENSLKIIIRNFFKNYLERSELSIDEILDDMYDYAPLISGGYILKINDQVVATPVCCCGLEIVEEWIASLEENSGEIYNGHDANDSIFYKRKSGNVIINVGDNSQYSVGFELYEEMIEKIESEIDCFIDRVAPVLNILFNISSGEKLAKTMIYRDIL